MITTAAYGTGSAASGQVSSKSSTNAAGASTAQVLHAVEAAPSKRKYRTISLRLWRTMSRAPLLSLLPLTTFSLKMGAIPVKMRQRLGSACLATRRARRRSSCSATLTLEMWFPGFNAVATRKHWKLVLLMKSSCPAVDLSFWYWPTNTPYSSCGAWHHYVTSRINKMDPAVVVLTSWWHGNGIIPNGSAPTLAQWQAGLERAITSITSPGTKKVVWGDIPYLAQAGPICLRPTRQTCKRARHPRARPC